MSRLDEELRILRANLAVLEEKQKIEMEVAAAKKANPLKTLEDIFKQIKDNIERMRESKHPVQIIYANQTVSLIEPIVDMLKNIQERLDVLEQK